MNIYDLINKKKKKQKAKAVKKAALTATIGVTAGAAAGILLAPKSGKETRKDIVIKSTDAKDKLIEKTTTTKSAISTKLNQHKKDLTVAKEKIAEYLASKKCKAEEINDAGIEIESEISEELSEEEIVEDTTLEVSENL